MVDHTHKKDKECCTKENQEKKLVKATDLPLHGNPYPPKDVVENQEVGMLEAKVRSLRTMLQPYVSPIASAYEKTNDVISIGFAHSQSSLQRLAENQSSVLNAILISSAGLLGFGLARRRGTFKRLLFGSVFFGGAMCACYPKEAEEKAQLLWYIAQNKLPVVAKQQYEKFTQKAVTEQNTGNKTVEDKETKS